MPNVLADLTELTALAPNHLPAELALIRQVDQELPLLPQVVCFDTGFHRTMPDRATRLPLPRFWHDKELRRFGFHGLSCEFILLAIRGQIDAETAMGRILIAHLGNGASLTAIVNGCSVDTTMGFSPAGGLMMGTRSGDLDPDRNRTNAPVISPDGQYPTVRIMPTNEEWVIAHHTRPVLQFNQPTP